MRVQENYRKRAGGESVNSAVKRVTGLARFRVRGWRAGPGVGGVPHGDQGRREGVCCQHAEDAGRGK